MRARIPFVMCLAALLAVACQDTPVEPVATPVATAPEFNFMNGPEEAGVVVRYEETYSLFTFFPETPAGEPWIVWFGIEGDDPRLCGGDPTSSPWDVHEVASKQGQEIIVNQMNKEAGVTFFRFSEFFPNWLIGGPGYAFCNTTAIGGGLAHGKYNVTPAGTFHRFHGTIDWMDETYRIKFELMFEDEFGVGLPVKETSRIW
ncbi:MAG: hypothetical protein M8861_06285 [marine benthic group bacterium]|nr:hypothetical protein [Gemmatimonadota bacterium]